MSITYKGSGTGADQGTSSSWAGEQLRPTVSVSDSHVDVQGTKPGIHRIGRTQCYLPTAHETVVNELAVHRQIVRVVGGIPQPEVLAQAQACLAPVLGACQESTAFLIGCTHTRKGDGSEVHSVPEQGIALQRFLDAGSTHSRVFGTLPLNGVDVKGEGILLRQQAHSKYSTWMHPDLRHGIFFDEGARYTWSNEARGVAKLAAEYLQKNSDGRYRALFIGGGQATEEELRETLLLAARFPGQVDVVLCWNTGGIAQRAAGRLGSPHVFRVALSHAGIASALSAREVREHISSHGPFLAAVKGRLDHLQGKGLPHVASGTVASHRSFERALHLACEGYRVIRQSLDPELAGIPGTRVGANEILRGLEHKVAVRERPITSINNGSFGGGALDTVHIAAASYGIAREAFRTFAGAQAVDLGSAPFDALELRTSLERYPDGTLVQCNGRSYVIAHVEGKDRALVAAEGGEVLVVPGTALAGLSVDVSVAQHERRGILGCALETVPLDQPRWEKIAQGTVVAYYNRNRVEVSHDEVLAIRPVPPGEVMGSHVREVTLLRTSDEGRRVELLTETRLEISMVIPPSEVRGAVEVRVFCPREAGLPVTTGTTAERREQRKVARLERECHRLLNDAYAELALHETTTELTRAQGERKASAVLSPSSLNARLARLNSRSREKYQLSRALSAWCAALEQSESVVATALIFAAQEKIITCNVAGESLAKQLRVLVEIIPRVPFAHDNDVIDLVDLQDKLLLLAKGLEEQALTEITAGAYSLALYRGSSVPQVILDECSRIAASRVLDLGGVESSEDLRLAFDKGGFLFSEYTPEYLRCHLAKGATLLTVGRHCNEKQTPSCDAFALVDSPESLGDNLANLLPELKNENRCYINVLVRQEGASALLSTVLLRAALTQSAARDAESVLAIINDANQPMRNLATKFGAVVKPAHRLRLTNPSHHREGYYSLYEWELGDVDSHGNRGPKVAKFTEEGFLTSTPDEFIRMSAVASLYTEMPYTRFALGIDSIQGRALDDLLTFVRGGALSGVSGVLSALSSRTIRKLDTEFKKGDDTPWIIRTGTGDTVIREVYNNRAPGAVTVGLSCLDERDEAAGTTCIARDSTGEEYTLTVLRGGAEQRIVSDPDVDLELAFNIRIPSSHRDTSFWKIATLRGIELGSLFLDRMTIFAGGGVTLQEDFINSIESAIALQRGITHLVLITGAGGMSDYLAETKDELLTRYDPKLLERFVKVYSVSVHEDADGLKDILRSTGRA